MVVSKYGEEGEREEGGWIGDLAYLVNLVVVLGVELEDLLFLAVVEVLDEVIKSELCSPLLAVDEPGRH
jgi:hypothetical protein